MSMPRIIKNYNLILDGFSQRHLCTSVSLPTIAHIIEEHRAGGMDAPAPVEFGLEMLTLSATLAERSEAIQVLVGRTNQNSVAFQLRASLTADTGEETPFIVTGRGMVTSLSGAELETGAPAPMDIEMGLRYYKLVQGDRTIHEIDVDNFIRVIDGVDQLAARRSILFG